MTRLLTRRRALLTGLAAPTLLAGCNDEPVPWRGVLSTGEWLSYRSHRLIGRNALAREYPPEAMSPEFRTNGNTAPKDPEWQKHARSGFADWRLRVDGKVRAPAEFSLADLRARTPRTQITRHDCVEGWSAIGQWTGVPLGPLLDEVGLADEARFIMFHCYDDLWGLNYYESVDLIDAYHPQTILAYGMNGADLPLPHGAPIRLRVERQLGYKHAKFIRRIEARATLDGVGAGRGGIWQDIGNYEWYAGI